MLKALQIAGSTTKPPAAEHVVSFYSTVEQTHQNPPCTSSDSNDQYNIFHDYLGLFNVVSNMRRDQQQQYTHSSARERRDSLGSAASSEFSACTGSADSTDSSMEYFTYPATPHEFFRPPQIIGGADTDDFMMMHLSSDQRPSSTLLERGNLSIRLPTRPVKQQVCVFCRNNGESESFYTSHCLKDAEGKVTCPVLRAYTCPLCGANGDASHTIKYCPENSQASKVATVANQMKRATITITRKK